jgi:hypothetical protein
MKTRILILTLVLFFFVTGAALANSGLELPRVVLNGGASDSTAGDVGLRATLGQSAVGVVSHGNIRLGQGFWLGGSLPEGGNDIYLPLVQR